MKAYLSLYILPIATIFLALKAALNNPTPLGGAVLLGGTIAALALHIYGVTLQYPANYRQLRKHFYPVEATILLLRLSGDKAKEPLLRITEKQSDVG